MTPPNQMPNGFVQTDPSQVPPQWASIGVSHGFQPTVSEKLRIFVTSQPGYGKTSFVMGRPRNLVLSFENSAKFVPTGPAHYMYVGTVKKYREITAMLEQEKDSTHRTYDCVTYDLTDQAVNLIDKELCKKYERRDEQGRVTRSYNSMSEYGQGGKGMSLIREAFTEELETLTRWGYAWMCTSHLVEKTMSSPDGKEYQGIRISVYPSVAHAILKLCDYMMGIVTEPTNCVRETEEPIVGPDGKVTGMRTVRKNVRRLQRYLTTSSDLVSNAKKRVFKQDLYIPIEADNGWELFSQAYNRGCLDILEENDTPES